MADVDESKEKIQSVQSSRSQHVLNGNWMMLKTAVILQSMLKWWCMEDYGNYCKNCFHAHSILF
jgi:hypothetical protein